ncbi:MAG: hypothetical protein WC824_05480 [Bacteroidota bacterium]|jgi:transposase
MDTWVIDADSAMKSIRSRIMREKHRVYVKRLAKREGFDCIDEAAVLCFGGKCKGGMISNKDCLGLYDPDAKIGPAKDSGTWMIYKPKHLVEMETGSILDATVLLCDERDATEMIDQRMDMESRKKFARHGAGGRVVTTGGENCRWKEIAARTRNARLSNGASSNTLDRVSSDRRQTTKLRFTHCHSSRKHIHGR